MKSRTTLKVGGEYMTRSEAGVLHHEPDLRVLQRAPLVIPGRNGYDSTIPLDETQSVVEGELFDLHDRALGLLLRLTADGYMPASEDLRFHHAFGRDTMISSYFIAKAGKLEPATQRSKEPYQALLRRTKIAVFNFWNNQLDNGQLPHEVKPYNEEDAGNPFFHEVSGMLVNDDSVDATALSLIVLPEFIETEEEFELLTPRIYKALDWMTHNMDTEGYNGWLCYKYNDHNGGHISQGLLDARDVITYGVTSNRDNRPVDPIALADVQAYVWKAFRIWAEKLRGIDPQRSEDLSLRAHDLRRRFNEAFVMQDEKGAYLARAIDGNGDQIRSITAEPGLALWASYNHESVVDQEHIPAVVTRLLSPEMFSEQAGIRVFENGQETYQNHEWYQTGDDQFWPILTVMSADGMDELGYHEEARRVMMANMVPLRIYGSFVEHFIKNRVYIPLFEKSNNSVNQTWTAASTLFATALLLDSDDPQERAVA